MIVRLKELTLLNTLLIPQLFYIFSPQALQFAVVGALKGFVNYNTSETGTFHF